MKQFVVTLELDLVDERRALHSFLHELSLFLGVLTTELRMVHAHRGCTLIHGFAACCAVERVEQYYQLAKGEDAIALHPEILAFKEFLKRWLVSRFQVCTPSLHARELPPAPREENCAVVFVHGWGGSAQSTFGHFPEYTKAGTGASSYVYAYPSHWLKNSPSIAFIARNLDNWIRLRTLAKRIAIVGHSLGGVISRYLAVIQECRDPKLPVRLVALAASPTNGALVATIASSVPVLRSAQLEELRPNSGFLVDLNERWAWWCKMYTPDNVKVGSMFAMNDLIVPFTSAIGNDPNAVPIFGADHVSIVKPSSPSDETVMTLLRFCREAGITPVE